METLFFVSLRSKRISEPNVVVYVVSNATKRFVVVPSWFLGFGNIWLNVFSVHNCCTIQRKKKMPILVKDFTWVQTTTTLHIRIPLNPATHEKVDFFTTDSYIKVHFKPNLFEAFLLHQVDNSKSKCLVKDDMIVLDLTKREEINWHCLEKDLSKAEKMQLKQDMLEKCQQQAKQESEDRRIKKTQLDRFTVQQAMSIDEQQHKLMESRREDERNKVMDALEDWRLNSEEEKVKANYHTTKKPSVKVVELPSSEDENDGKMSKDKVNTGNDINERKTPVKSEYVEKKKWEAATRVLPKLRQSAELEVRHTPRTFPTPSRESTAREEEAWLRNITLARRATGFVSEDLRPEEHDPQWCKEKGDEFFRNANYLGAISAYTHGITLSDKLPSLFANRAATHFALGNFNKCLNDCSTALELMTPACEGNRRSRAKCIARRAAALARVGYLSKAIDEMKAAARLLPEDEAIRQDIEDMERAWEQNPDSD